MINLWFVNCPCIEEIPELKTRIKSKTMEIKSISHSNDKEHRKFLSKNEFKFTHIIDAQK
jgi:peroxiredoxin